ncbi:MAG: GNAT family N-acetyltransferase [Lachnospiraceae bacterium]|nr:GNAT family N-acetyltransferase [Lachnospiraceae bacterium]
MKIVLCENIDWLLSEEAFSIYASCMYHPTYEEYKAQMEDYLHDSSVKVFVCENRGKRIGMMVLKISGVAADIIGIAVSDNARRKGIGKQLIQSVIKSEEIERIKAQTDEDSIGFYRKCGFSEERIVKEYPDGAVVRYNCALYK